MSNARNLADLLAPGENTLQTVAIETDRIILNGTDGSATNAGDDLLLDASAASTDVGERFTYEDGTSDASSIQVNQESLVTNQLQGLTDSGSITVRSEGGAVFTNLQQGLAKAWIDFNGTGTIAIADSFNITSIADNGTGDYSVTIANDMANANYVHAGNSGGGNGTSIGAVYANDQNTTRTTTLFRVYLLGGDNSPVDTPTINIIVSGDLA